MNGLPLLKVREQNKAEQSKGSWYQSNCMGTAFHSNTTSLSPLFFWKHPTLTSTRAQITWQWALQWALQRLWARPRVRGARHNTTVGFLTEAVSVKGRQDRGEGREREGNVLNDPRCRSTYPQVCLLLPRLCVRCFLCQLLSSFRIVQNSFKSLSAALSCLPMSFLFYSQFSALFSLDFGLRYFYLKYL